MEQKENQVLVGLYSANDPFGPIKYPGMNVVVNHEGIQAKNFVFTGSRGKPDPWAACWIWLNSSIYPEYQKSPFTRWCTDYSEYHSILALFRKEIDLPCEPRGIIAWVSADTKYRLYVNGKMVGRGPLTTGGDWGMKRPPEHWYYDFYNLAQYFHKGKNVICAEVLLKTFILSEFSMGRGGFLFEAKGTGASGAQYTLKTDATWRGTRNKALLRVDRYDARLEPVGWQKIDFNDTNWPYAEPLYTPPEGPWHLTPRQIPPLMEAQVVPNNVMIPDQCKNRIMNVSAMLTNDVSKTTIKPGSPVVLWVDFGKEVVGHPKFTVKGNKGTQITIKIAEILGKIKDSKDYPLRHSESYILREGLQSFETFRLYGFQYLQLTIDNISGPLEIEKITTTFTSYPVEYKGDFSCSDNLCNEIWKVGRWTTQLCMQDYHLDSPIHQEPLGDVGDYLVESLINYYTFGDSWLTRQDLLKIAYLLEQKDGQMFMPSYSLLVVQMLADYYRYTGDKELLENVASSMHNLLDLFENYRGTTGLIENPPNYMFMDWSCVDNFTLHHPPKIIGQGYMNAFYCKALKDGAYISRIVGNNNKADYYERLLKATVDSFNKELWIDEKELYCDGKSSLFSIPSSTWLPADVDKIYFSQHTNALAVAYDIAPKGRQEAIIRQIVEDKSLIEAQPYFMHFVFEALHHADHFGRYGFHLIRRWKKLLAEHPTSWKETWDWGDYSHAWSGTPTYQLSSKVLGITPLEPGFDIIGVRPITGDFRWARGKVPTPHGVVSISWARRNSKFKEHVVIPEGSQAKVSVPKVWMKNVVVKEQGQIIWKNSSLVRITCGITSASEDSKYVTFHVRSGSYHFEVSEVKKTGNEQ